VRGGGGHGSSPSHKWGGKRGNQKRGKVKDWQKKLGEENGGEANMAGKKIPPERPLRRKRGDVSSAKRRHEENQEHRPRGRGSTPNPGLSGLEGGKNTGIEESDNSPHEERRGGAMLENETLPNQKRHPWRSKTRNSRGESKKRRPLSGVNSDGETGCKKPASRGNDAKTTNRPAY